MKPREPGREASQRECSTVAYVEPGNHALGAPALQAASNIQDDLQQYFFESAQYQSQVYAAASAIGFLAGIVGRAFNTPTGAGLNQFILILGDSGSGKDIAASGTSKLFAALAVTNPTIRDYIGPGELVSGPGIIKWLAKQPCCYSIVGEIGKLMKLMASPKPQPNFQTLNRTLLQLYSKSAAGETFDPIAYSDTEKNTAPIQSPSLTLLGESVPCTFYDALDESMIVDGWTPRFLVFEETSQRSYRNEAADNYQLNPNLLSRISDLAAYCSALMNKGQALRVAWTPASKAKFGEFEHWTTDQWRAASRQSTKELWNRANLKALKLASVRAVGRNYLQPEISLDDTMWATELVVAQTLRLIAKLENGETGGEAGNEIKQQNEILLIINRYIRNDYSYSASFHGSADMHRDTIITLAHIQQRAGRLACFRNDRLGSTNAIKRTLKYLDDANIIQQISVNQMAERYGSRAVAYCVVSPKEFTKEFDRRGLGQR